MGHMFPAIAEIHIAPAVRGNGLAVDEKVEINSLPVLPDLPFLA
jgi:hypothetical protein